MITGVRKNLKIGLAFVDDGKMRELNKKYRRVDEPTDVLSFPFNEDLPDGTYFLGEIVINGDQVRSKEEILELIRHGAKNLLKSVNESAFASLTRVNGINGSDSLTH